ncbi:MAG: hypothetical protein ABW061_26625, partial [Polyangiaceae bacterium]
MWRNRWLGGGVLLVVWPLSCGRTQLDGFELPEDNAGVGGSAAGTLSPAGRPTGGALPSGGAGQSAGGRAGDG